MLKENWTNTDKLNYSNFNLIVDNIIKICDKLNIEVSEKYEKLRYRKIKVGDDLSGKTLYMNFDAIEAYNSLETQEYSNDIIVTSTNRIYEDVYNFNGYYKTLQSSDNTCLFNYYYMDYVSGNNPEVNLKEYALPNDFGIVTAIDTNSYFYNNIQIKADTVEPKEIGDFLYSNDLNEVENILKKICSRLLLDYEYREWYHLSAVSYEDVNRWCKTINLINTLEINKYKDLTDKIYSDFIDKTYKQILYKED